IADFDTNTDMLPVNEWLEIDQYALYLTHQLQTEILADYDNYEFHLAVQKFVSFCSENLGGFYLDILKDRLYTTGESSHARRAAQSALHHITQTMMRLMAPILSFTANEIWQTLAIDADKTVFEDVWYALPEHGLTAERLSAWGLIVTARGQAAKEIELLRAVGLVGSSLQAELDFYTTDASYEALNSLGDDLRFVMITSSARVYRMPGDTAQKILVTPSSYIKCDRCWHYRADTGRDPAHPQLCGRCVNNLFGAGEARSHA
ncbi:MAG: isoleucine--tRNA ligase, partial [Methylotenera sp.]|nr:isoleucine--tRNA ligase [Methylotenera sp.]